MVPKAVVPRHIGDHLADALKSQTLCNNRHHQETHPKKFGIFLFEFFRYTANICLEAQNQIKDQSLKNVLLLLVPPDNLTQKEDLGEQKERSLIHANLIEKKDAKHNIHRTFNTTSLPSLTGMGLQAGSLVWARI